MVALVNPRTWSLLDPLSDTILNAGVRDPIQQLLPLRVVKSADQSVTSSTTPVDDLHLQLPVAANADYEIALHIIYTQGTTGQLGITFTAPGGSTFDWMTVGLDVTVTASQTGSVRLIQQSIGSTQFVGGNSTATVARVFGLLSTGAASGTFKFRWAQSVSNATPVVVKTRSHLIMRQIA